MLPSRIINNGKGNMSISKITHFFIKIICKDYKSKISRDNILCLFLVPSRCSWFSQGVSKAAMYGCTGCALLQSREHHA